MEYPTHCTIMGQEVEMKLSYEPLIAKTPGSSQGPGLSGPDEIGGTRLTTVVGLSKALALARVAASLGR